MCIEYINEWQSTKLNGLTDLENVDRWIDIDKDFYKVKVQIVGMIIMLMSMK